MEIVAKHKVGNKIDSYTIVNGYKVMKLAKEQVIQLIKHDKISNAICYDQNNKKIIRIVNKVDKKADMLYELSKKIYTRWKLSGKHFDYLIDAWKQCCSNIGYTDPFEYFIDDRSFRESRRPLSDEQFLENSTGYIVANYMGSNKGICKGTILPYFVQSTMDMFRAMKLDMLDLSSFNTSRVRDMSNMFNFCKCKLINISSFDTSNVDNMSFMFYTCSTPLLDFSSFNTSNVSDMSYMFGMLKLDCGLDLRSFDTTNVISMERMFYCCQSKYLNINNFSTDRLKNTHGMFAYCKVDKLDLSRFNTMKVPIPENIFDSTNIRSVVISDKCINLRQCIPNSTKVIYKQVV